MTGKIHSFQSLGTLDGPGVRFVVFMQGCNLRCGCCHNPDTWSTYGGTEYTPSEVLTKALRFKEYFGHEGGITVSGGEPLLQAGFVSELFKLCKANGINTCLDTSGSILNDDVTDMLEYTDCVLLDIKYTDEAKYRDYVGCDISLPLGFLKVVDEKRIPVTIRQVIIPELNDSRENLNALNDIAKRHTCVDKIELLPFKKICQTKYDNMNIAFRFSHMRTPTAVEMRELESLIDTKYR